MATNKYIIEKLIDEQEQFEEKIKFLQEQNKTLEEENELLKKTRDEFVDVFKGVSVIVDNPNFPRIGEQILIEMRKLKDENKTLEERQLPFGWTTNTLKNLQEVRDELKEKNTEQSTEIINLEGTISSMKEAIRMLKDENKKLQEDNKEWEINFKEEREEKKKFKEENKRLEEEIRMLKDCNIMQYSYLVQGENKLLKEWQDMKNEIGWYAEKVEVLEKQLDSKYD